MLNSEQFDIMPDADVFFDTAASPNLGQGLSMIEYAESKRERINAKKEKRRIRKHLGKAKMKNPILKHTYTTSGKTLWIVYDDNMPGSFHAFKGFQMETIRDYVTPSSLSSLYLFAKEFNDFMRELETSGYSLSDRKNPYIPYLYLLVKNLQELIEKDERRKELLYGVDVEKIRRYCEECYPEVKRMCFNLQELKLWYNGIFDRIVQSKER